MGEFDQNAVERRKELSSVHLIDFRNNVMKCSQEALGEKIGVTGLTIGRYERKETGISKKNAAKLAELSGYIIEYWLGETDCKTQEAFWEECESTGLEEFHRAQDIQLQKNERIKSLLSLCGYGYENLPYTPGFDFVQFFDKTSDVAKDLEMVNAGYPHKIVNHNASTPFNAAYFNDAELSELLDNIQGIIGYTCYRKNVGK